MFRKSKAKNFYLYSTEVENVFISDLMIGAKGEYVKAYLLALMYAQLSDVVDSDIIKRQLQFSDEEMEECWSYWESLGVIKRNEYDVELLNLRELIASPAAGEDKENLPLSDLNDKELAQLYKSVQIATGRMLELREMEEIVSWISEYSISPELIIFCYSYCAEKRRSNSFRYVGTILKDWSKKGIRSRADAESYLSESDGRFSVYKEIFTELGFSRNPSAEEKRLMDAWVDEFKFSMKDILNACKQTAGISNPNLRYVDAVLKNLKGSAEATKRENLAVLVSREYEKIRRENENKAREKREKIFAEIPRIRDIMQEIGAESIKQSKALLRHDNLRLKEAKEKIAALLSEKACLLEKAGYDKDATDNIYSCRKCKDTGILEDGGSCSCYGEILNKINGKG